MTHIPTIESINAWCPACKLRFALVVVNRCVVCPGCDFVQNLPIVNIGKNEFRCLDCQVTFTATPPLACCHECGATRQITEAG